MHVALLGGAFDPPHVGHVLMAQQLLDFMPVDEVWLLPNFSQSAPVKATTAVEHRVAMTRLLETPKIRVSTIELDHKLSGETIEIVPHLPREHEFFFVIGSDLLPGFTQWKDYEQLLAALPFWVFPRAGHPSEPIHKGMMVIEHELLVVTNISSTIIRDRVARGFSIDELIPQGIGDYIQRHGLYGSSKGNK